MATAHQLHEGTGWLLLPADQLRHLTAASCAYNETRRDDNTGRKLLQCLDVMKECALDQELFLIPWARE